MWSNRAARRCAAALALGLLPLLGYAQAREPAVDSLRPTGPVTVTADRAEWEQNGAMIYSGNVALNSDTLKLKGDRLELRQHPGGQFEARVSGNPARLDHPGLKDRKGVVGPPVSAEARTLNYDSRSGVVDVLGNARLLRGQDEINGESIRYDVIARRIRAAGGAGGQVKIVIQPPPAAGKAAPAAPAPAVPAAPSAPPVPAPEPAPSPQSAPAPAPAPTPEPQP